MAELTEAQRAVLKVMKDDEEQNGLGLHLLFISVPREAYVNQLIGLGLAQHPNGDLRYAVATDAGKAFLDLDHSAYDAAIAQAVAAYETALGSPEAVTKAKDVLEALHAFAQATPAALGCDVTLWFIKRHAVAVEAHSAVMRAHFEQRRREAKP